MRYNKYGNYKTVTSDGNLHDSRKEARRWQELNLLLRAGVIKDLRRQVKFVLIPRQIETFERYGAKGQRLKDGERVIEKECSYVADFVYYNVETGKIVVEDTKSEPTRTKDYRIKKKLMLWVHKIKISEI
jgi:hypothetical protein